MSLDPSIIERYAKLMELKAGSRVARFTLLGFFLGALVGGSPLLAGKIHLIHSAIPSQYGFGLAIAGAAGGAYLGYLVGQSRAVALRLQAHVAVHQLEVERLIRRLDGLRLPMPEPDVAVLASEPVEPLPVAAPAPSVPAPVAAAAPAPPEPVAAPVEPPAPAPMPAPMPAPVAAPAPPPAPEPEPEPVHTFSFQTVPVSSPPTSSTAPLHPAPAPMSTFQPMPPAAPATEPAPFPAAVQAFPAPTSFFVPVSEPAPSPVPVSAPTPVPAPPQLVPEPEPQQQQDQPLEPPTRLAPPPPAPFEWATPPADAVRSNP